MHALIGIMRSRFCRASLHLAKKYSSVAQIPLPSSSARAQLSGEMVELLGWYGSNTLGYGYRKLTQSKGTKPYLGILNDVAKLLNKRLPKRDRKKLPLAGGVSDLEKDVVEILLGLRFGGKKSTEKIVQILEESGLEKHVAEEVATRYGTVGLGGVSLPMLTKVLGKKSVMNIVQAMVVSIVGKFIGKEAAKQMAKRVALKITQKALTRMIIWIGWILLGADIVGFATSPARRVTVKVIPFIALVRVRERLAQEEKLEDKGRI